MTSQSTAPRPAAAHPAPTAAPAPPDGPAAIAARLAALREDDDYSHWLGTARLLEREREAGRAPSGRPVRLAVLSTHTSALFAALLPAAGLSVGLDLTVYQAPYGQLEQELLAPDSELRRFRPDYVLLSGVAEDLLPGRDAGADPDALVEAAVQRWTGLWDAVRALPARVLQHTFVPPTDDVYGNGAARFRHSFAAVVERVDAALFERGGDGRALFVDCAQLAADFGRRAWRDPRYWLAVRQAVSLDALPALARTAAAVICADQGLTRRCVVVDLDNTLWGGVLGEEGAGGVALGHGAVGEAFTLFQEYLLALKRRGLVLAVASKNDQALVDAAFYEVPGMRLRREDFAAVVADWRPKSEQLRDISRRIGLGLASLLFVDDNPAECAQVSAALPEVDVLCLPPRPADYVRALARRPTLQVADLTEADRRRSASYAALGEAERLREGGASLDDFLHGLEMRARVRPVDSSTLARAAQMIGKTNQFNLTTRRRTAEELAVLVESPEWICLTLALADRFTDHGVVGLALARIDGSAADLDTVLLSCRVIGRTAERHLLAEVARRAAAAGCTRLVGRYIPTDRNDLVRECYPGLGFRPVPAAGAEWEAVYEYELPGDGLSGPYIKDEEEQ